MRNKQIQITILALVVASIIGAIATILMLLVCVVPLVIFINIFGG